MGPRPALPGAGVARYGGRFNARGRPALFASPAPDTAIREANQVGFLEPTVLVAYHADIAPIFDATDPDCLREYGMSAAALADPAWRHRMNTGVKVPTQDLAGRLIAAGYARLLVTSFAAGATAADLNLVLWRWNSGEGTQLDLIDGEGRLSR